MSVLTMEPESAQLSMDLSVDEQTELALCEAVVKRGRQVFLEVGGALSVIKSKRLFRATHDNFEDYCQEVHDISLSSAYAFIRAFGITETLQNSAKDLPLPGNPDQALALRNVPKEEQAEVWEKAVETAPEGNLTAAHVQETANKHLGKPEPEAPAPKEESTAASEPEAKTVVSEIVTTIEKTVEEKSTVTDNRSSTQPPAVTKPTNDQRPTTPAPPAGGSDFVQCLIPRDEDDWLWEQGLTAATAIAELRSTRAQLYNANLSLRRPQLTDKAYRMLLALTEDHNAKHPGEPILPVQMLQASLEVRCGILGITIPESDESEETTNEQ